MNELPIRRQKIYDSLPKEWLTIRQIKEYCEKKLKLGFSTPGYRLVMFKLLELNLVEKKDGGNKFVYNQGRLTASQLWRKK